LQGQAGGVMVYQRNPITGAMGDYHYPSNSPSESAIAGVEATLAYDPTQWTLMGMLADGEVRILRLWHLAPRTGWVTVTPLEGSTPPEDADVITVGFDARDLPEEATLNAGLIIESNGEEPRVTIPLRMAANPNSVPGETGEVFPTTLAIRSATPNPFNGRTMIAIDVPRSSRLKLSVYDLAGRLVRTIHDGEVGAGQATFSLTMDAAPSGVYLLSAITLGGSDLHKIVLVR